MVTLELSCLSLDKEGLPEVDLRLLMRSNLKSFVILEIELLIMPYIFRLKFSKEMKTL